MSILLKKTIFAAIFGNVLECYDFTVYAFLSPILAMIFFPNTDQNHLISLLLTFSIFALGFLVRPLGAILFGYLGDHFGRKPTLLISILVMSIPTFLLGLLPSYSSIGIWAPILLTLLRFAQGIAVSGEMTTAMTYLVEHAPHQHRGFMGSLALCSSCGGGVLSSGLIVLLTFSMSYEQLVHWGWRLPFLIGGLLGMTGFIMRLRSPFFETLLYQTAKQSLEKIRPPLFQHYRQLHYKPILIAILLTSIMAMSYYIFVGYFNTFLINTMRQPVKIVMFINFSCQILLTILLPIFGMISDKMGRKPVFIAGVIGLTLLMHPIFWLLQKQTTFLFFLSECLFVFVLAPIIASLPSLLAEMFHVHTRNSGISLGYNMGQAIFGGTAPIIALALITHTHNLYAPAWYLLGGAILSLFTLLKVKESYQQPLT